MAFLDRNPDGALFADWAVTTCFYVAVHYIDAWLHVAGGCNPGDHGERKTLADRWGNSRSCRTRGYGAMMRHYRELETLSRNARYECIPMRPEDVDQARNTLLAHVQRWVDGELRARGCGGGRI